MFSTIWNTQRFTELGREEKGEGGDRGDLVEKKESLKKERAFKPVISFSSKNGCWKLGFWTYKIDNKYKKAKIKNLEKRLDFQKYNIKEKKKKKVTKIIKIHIYVKFALKIGSFFLWKVIVGYKNEN